MRYRYYISRKDKERLDLPVVRIPAGNIEDLVVHQLRRHTEASWEGTAPSRAQVLALFESVVVHADRIDIRLAGVDDPVSIAASLIRRSGEKRIAVAPEHYAAPRRDPALIKLIVRAHQAARALANASNPTIHAAADSIGVTIQYFRTLLRFASLAPDIIAAILDGRQPAHVNRQFLARFTALPVDWANQREMLGFA